MLSDLYMSLSCNEQRSCHSHTVHIISIYPIGASHKKEAILAKLNSHWLCTIVSSLFTFHTHHWPITLLHKRHFYLVCPDVLSLVGEPLGRRCGSPNHIQF